MKISTEAMIIIVTALSILPFIWFTFAGKRSAGKDKKAIKDLVKDENLTFNHEEFWNHNFLGLDEAKNTLVFVKLSPSENQIVKIILNEVKSCKIDKITKDFKREKKVESELQKLNLELVFTSQKPNAMITLYDIQDNLAQDFEMKRAEKWQKLIHENTHKSHATAA